MVKLCLSTGEVDGPKQIKRLAGEQTGTGRGEVQSFEGNVKGVGTSFTLLCVTWTECRRIYH